MAFLAYPLERNTIRRESRNHTFGMVRNGGTRAHQGWDLVAYPGTLCFAVADGKIASIDHTPDYGLTVLLEFSHGGQTWYALYAHLSDVLTLRNRRVARSELIGRTGNSGNAASMRGEDQHLHFEIRSLPHVGRGLAGRVDPGTFYPLTPLGFTYYEGHGAKLAVLGNRPGIKVPGVNMRD